MPTPMKFCYQNIFHAGGCPTISSFLSAEGHLRSESSVGHLCVGHFVAGEDMRFDFRSLFLREQCHFLSYHLTVLPCVNSFLALGAGFLSLSTLCQIIGSWREPSCMKAYLGGPGVGRVSLKHPYCWGISQSIQCQQYQRQGRSHNSASESEGKENSHPASHLEYPNITSNYRLSSIF